MTQETELRKEWHQLVDRLDCIFDEAEKTYWNEGGLQLLWRERAKIHRRIAEIAATGITFDESAATREP